MNANEFIRQIEAETHSYYALNHADFRNRGYHIMYGPPRECAPILFLGYQPGGDHYTDDHQRPRNGENWPEITYYATEPWPLARNMRAMFGTELLGHCTGLNAIFFRSPKMEVYQAEVPLARRREAAAFCTKRVRGLIALLRPRLVVGIGFETLRLFGSTEPHLKNERNRTLLVAGSIGGIPSFATLHLSGARIARRDRLAIAEALLQRVGMG